MNESLHISGAQYNRAFQDLINCLGRFMGFEVVFGRYQGVQGQIGFDGLWKSPSGFCLVIEVKTTEVYAIKTSTLMSYINELISEKTITNLDHALGLYVVGRSDPEVRQLENAILAEKRMDNLRVISAESLLSLAELMKKFNVSHEDILAILRPSGPIIDSVIDLMERLAKPGVTEEPKKESTETEIKSGESQCQIPNTNGTTEKITSVSSPEETWKIEELMRYLNDATPYQRLLLAALAQADEGPTTRKKIISLMNIIVGKRPAENINKKISGRDIAGARAGLKLRRKDLKKEDVITSKWDPAERDRTYIIKNGYKKSVMEWVKQNNLWVKEEL